MFAIMARQKNRIGSGDWAARPNNEPSPRAGGNGPE
jgi:hypothetical protein